LLDIARNYYNLNNNKEALKYYKKYLELDQSSNSSNSKHDMDSISYYNLASIYQTQRNHELALKYFSLSHEKDNDNYLALINMGVCYFKLKKKEESKNCFIEALKKNINKSNECICYLNLGLIFFEYKQYGKSLKYANLSNHIENTQLESTLLLLGNNYYEVNKLEEALKYYLLVDREYNNIDKFTCLKIGKIYLLQENNTEAQHYFDKYVDLHGNKAEAYFYIGFEFVKESIVTEESLNYFLKVIDLDPNFSNVNFFIGHYYAEIHDHHNAIKYYLISVDVDGPSFDLYNFLGYHFAELEKFNESKNNYLKALELSEESDTFYNVSFNIARNYFKLQNFDKALPYCLKASEIDSENVDIHILTGLCYLGKNSDDEKELYEEKTKAIKHFEIAIKLDPINALAHNYLGEVLLEMYKESEAIEHLKLAIEFDPNILSAYTILGYLYTKNNSKVEAIDIYKRAIEIQPENSSAHISLSFLLRDLGKNMEADEHYQISLKLLEK